MINFLVIFMKYMQHGILYYWYTDNKKVAIGGALAGSLINIVFLTLASGGNAVLLVSLLLMDHLLIILLIFYFTVIRNFLYIEALQKNIDNYFLENFAYLIIGWAVNRIITNLIAEKFYNIQLNNHKVEQSTL